MSNFLRISENAEDKVELEPHLCLFYHLDWYFSPFPTIRFAGLDKLSLSWLLIIFATLISSMNSISAASSKAYLLCTAVCSKLRA